jgi:hypothetical protein
MDGPGDDLFEIPDFAKRIKDKYLLMRAGAERAFRTVAVETQQLETIFRAPKTPDFQQQAVPTPATLTAMLRSVVMNMIKRQKFGNRFVAAHARSSINCDQFQFQFPPRGSLSLAHRGLVCLVVTLLSGSSQLTTFRILLLSLNVTPLFQQGACLTPRGDFSFSGVEKFGRFMRFAVSAAV